MKKISEQPLNANVLSSIETCAQLGLEVLKIGGQKQRPAATVEALDAFVYAWQKGKRPPTKVLAPKDAPNIMGSLWGQQLVARFKWEWALLTFHQHGDSVAPGVLSPDRSLAVYPIHFLIGCFQDPTVDATIALSFNMLEAGTVTGIKPREYFNLMDGVQRIVPRD